MNKEKLEEMHRLLNSGELYDGVDEELMAEIGRRVECLNAYNRTPETEEGLAERERILRECTGTYGEGMLIIPPVYANHGLRNVHFGRNVILNFNVSFVDDADIFIGDSTLIGPGASLITAMHPVSPRLRKSGLQYNKPIHIGSNVWIGGGAIIMPGVTIGDNSIVGAGSVVTHDVEPDTIVVGSPARVLRKITERDNMFYDRDKPVPDILVDKYLK